MTWQERQKFFIQKTIEYWKSYPLRALHGWWWRFLQFLGYGGFAWQQKIYGSRPPILVHSATVSVLFILLITRILMAWRYHAKRRERRVMAGAVVALLFFLYASIHSIFAYANFRYVCPSIPFVIAADLMLLFEVTRGTALGSLIGSRPNV